jgi:hypothetical protein
MGGNNRLDDFISPGVIKISAAALQLAREFDGFLKQEKPEQDWIVCFDWADSRSMRFPRPGGPMQDLGPGFDLAAYERRQVPDEVTQHTDGIAFAIKVPSRVWLNSAQRTIDVDESGGSGLTLR